MHYNVLFLMLKIICNYCYFLLWVLTFLQNYKRTCADDESISLTASQKHRKLTAVDNLYTDCKNVCSV